MTAAARQCYAGFLDLADLVELVQEALPRATVQPLQGGIGVRVHVRRGGRYGFVFASPPRYMVGLTQSPPYGTRARPLDALIDDFVRVLTTGLLPEEGL